MALCEWRGGKSFLFLDHVGEGEREVDNMSYVETVGDNETQPDYTKLIFRSSSLRSM